MTTNRKQTGTTAKPSRIMLGTHVDIASAHKLWQRLKTCAAKNTDVNLHANKVETIDTAALQLLLAFVRQVRDNGKQVYWKSPSAALLNAAALTGLRDELLPDEAAG